MARDFKDLWYDIDRAVLLVAQPEDWDDAEQSSSSSGTEDAADLTENTSLPRLYLNNGYIVRLRLFSSNAIADVDWSLSWDGAIGPIGMGTPLVTIANADINTAGDWADVDPTYGRISVRLDLDAEALSTYIGISQSKRIYIELRGTDSDGATRVVAVIPALLINVVYDPA